MVKPGNKIELTFAITEGTDITAECALDKATKPDDDLMKGFIPQTYDSYSNFFEITKFEFGLKLHEDDGAVGGMSQSAKVTTKPVTDKKLTGEFVRWRSVPDEKLDKIKYPVEFETFSFSRMIDGASPIFFQRCCNSQSFASAALVKRVQTKVNERPRGFLRIDFENVLVIGVDWDDGDVLSETCKFICRKFTLKYCKQNADGSLDPPVSPPPTWEQLLSTTERPANGR